jgi:electron transport complex protein RnfB
MTLIWTALVMLAVLGAIFGWILTFASKKLAVESDPRVEQIVGVLPGANCGACGYPGCSGLAEAIVAGIAPVNTCPVGKTPCALKIGAIMGVEVDLNQKPKFAKLLCGGGKAERVDRFYYMGVADCGAAQMLNGGYKMCEFGCLGLGNCVRACKFEALTINDNELPQVNRKRCTGCGACVQACPRNLLKLVDEDSQVMVICKSHGKGQEVRKACKVGCIGCGICAKNCPAQAISLADNLPTIDPERCTACGICVEKCPMKTIHFCNDVTGKEVAQVSAVERL